MKNKMYSLLLAALPGGNSGFEDVDSFNERLQGIISDFRNWFYGIIGSLLLVWGAYIAILYIIAKKQEKKEEASDLVKRFFIGLGIFGFLAAVGGVIIGIMKSRMR